MYNSYSWICLFHSHCLLIHIQPHVISYFVHIHKRTRFIHIAPLFIHVFHLYSHLYNYAIDNNHSTSHIIILRIYCRYSFHTSLIRYTSQVGSNLFSIHLLNFFSQTLPLRIYILTFFTLTSYPFTNVSLYSYNFGTHILWLFNHTSFLHMYVSVLFALLFVYIYKNASLTFVHIVYTQAFRSYMRFTHIHKIFLHAELLHIHFILFIHSS